MFSGTRHEKIALVIASYVIGFITAYIAFGVNQLISAQLAVVIPTNTYVPTLAKKATEKAPEKITTLIMGDDGLSAVTQERALLLSANKRVLGSSVIGSTAGFHTSVIGAEADPNGLFVYFCEQSLDTDEDCVPYVFSLEEEKVHRVKINTEKSTLSLATHQASWTEEGLLLIGAATSENTLAPWNLIQVVEESTDAQNDEATAEPNEITEDTLLNLE